MEEYGSAKERKEGLAPYLSPLGAWSLAVGTAIGWGSFVFSSNFYLQQAGPLGSVLGMLAGMAVMLFISRNYHLLMNLFPDSGGVYTYIKHVFGYDRAFLSAWFLSLTYLSMLWANATSLPLFARNFFGDIFRVGFLYNLFGYDVYLGEVLLTMGAIVLMGLLCMKRERLAVKLMVLMALTFVAGIVICFAVAMLNRDPGRFPMEPLFVPNTVNEFSQVLNIALMAPWAFIGFENISHSDREFAFSRKKSFRILAVAVVTTTLLYIFVILLSISAFPPEYSSWTAYIGDLNNLQGIKNLPAFFAAQYYLGETGIYLLAAALLSLVLTSLIGNTVALSRLFYAAAKDEILPDRFAELNKQKNPEHAVELIMLLSLGIPLLGRTAVGWIVDITTIGAIIVYGMVSAAAYKVAKDNGLQTERTTGLFGLAVMVLFALLMIFPNLFTHDTLQKETYFLITAWSIVGFLFLRNILNRDYERNFGRSVIVWVAFLALILFMELNWLRTANLDYNLKSIESVRSYYLGHGTAEQYALGDKVFLERLKEEMRLSSMENNSIVLVLFLFSLGMFFSNYAVVKKRADETEAELGATRNLAFRDAMTGVKSKLAYTEAVSGIDRKIAEKSEEDFAVVVCDVNGLKHINDTYGHKAGDEYIRSASRLICEYFKHSPVFRTGGDEFVVILEGRDFENRALLMKAMDKRVEANIALQEVVVSASYSDFDKEKDTKFHDAFERADALMYERKKWLKKMGARTRE